MSADSENYYDDSPSSDSSGSGPGADGMDTMDGKTSILPRSFFCKNGQDLKPGDKCDVEVVSIHEDSVEVKPVAGKDDDDEAPSEAPPAAATGDMSGYME